MAWRELTNRQWEEVCKHLPEPPLNVLGGRPFADNRKCFEGILWILWTGSPWSELPERYGKRSTVHRRLQQWTNDGTLEKLWRAFLAQLNEEDHIRWDECFIIGTFFSAKKGDLKSERLSAVRDRSLWFWVMARVLRSDFTWTRRPQRKSGPSKRRSRPSGSPVSVQVVHVLGPND